MSLGGSLDVSFWGKVVWLIEVRLRMGPRDDPTFTGGEFSVRSSGCGVGVRPQVTFSKDSSLQLRLQVSHSFS